MRRTRARSYTIDAENKEEFNKKCENALKNEFSTINSLNNNKIKEFNEEEEYPQTNNDNNQKDIKKDFILDNFGDIINEDSLSEEIDSDEIFDKNDKNNYNQEEKNIDLLCLYLRQTIAIQSKGKHKNCHDNIFYRFKNPLHTLSGNAIYDLNIKQLVDEIMTENEFSEKNWIKNGENEKSNNLKEFIFQNIKSDCTLKIMILSNNDSTRILYIKKFFSIENEISENNYENNYNKYNDKIDFEIRKKQIKSFNKNITLQIFDTSDKFHNNSPSKIYYQFSNGFFIFIDATNHNIKKYLDNIFLKLENYLLEKTTVIFGVNMLFKKDCSIDGFNLREYASNKNCLYIPIKINDFTSQNSIIVNILNLILIKKIDNKKSCIKKNNKEDKKICVIKNKLTKKINNLSTKNVDNKFIFDISKMDIPNSLGFQNSYRIYHINAFDTEKYNAFLKKKSRKWSDGL